MDSYNQWLNGIQQGEFSQGFAPSEPWMMWMWGAEFEDPEDRWRFHQPKHFDFAFEKMENFIAIGIAPTHYRKNATKVEGNRMIL